MDQFWSVPIVQGGDGGDVYGPTSHLTTSHLATSHHPSLDIHMGQNTPYPYYRLVYNI